MTPLQLAQAECANYQHTGGCLGVHIGDAGRITHCDPKPRCALSDGERCRYLEDCVAPMADMVKEPRRSVAIQQAVRSYRAAHAAGEVPRRKCPDCSGPLPKFRQVCPDCADKRRKATFRRSQNRLRRQRGALSTEVRKDTPDFLENPHGSGGISRNPYRGSPHPQNGATSVDKSRLLELPSGRRA